ncbi:MAG TPA: glycosyltransferase family 4 protein, partial [Gaiellaceae bacterium]|nr:glycosyltransferase family 4 protein [Gaiellaceae bacterium]
YAVDLFAPFELPHLAPGVTAHPSPRLQSFALPSELNYFRHDDAVVRAVQEAAASAPPDFVYHRLSVHSHAGVRLSRALGAPLVLEYNGSEVWVAQHWGHRLRYERAAVAAEEALLRHAHVVVTISDVLRDELLERGVERERVVAYPNCVDPELFDPDRYGAADRSRIRERHGIAPDALVVTFVGTFGRWHGTEVLAQAIRRLESEDAAWLRERRLHFLLVGDGLRMPEVESALGGRRGAFHTLTGLVPQADAPAYLAASDIVVSPHVPNTDGSRFFGSPTKLFEYMAMALPIVASELDQLGQVLRPAARVAGRFCREIGDAVAVVVAPGDEAELAQALRRLADRPGWRERLGSNARRLALERYTWDAHVRAILDRLEAVCG